jgi:hemoglobin
MTQSRTREAAPGSLYQRIGGPEGIKTLVNTFYDLVEQHPAGRPVLLLQLRGHGIAHARIDQVNFLSGFFGGPRLFTERYGHSDVRKIHAHVEIDPEAKDSWLTCMDMAIDQLGLAPDLKQDLMTNFRVVAEALVNRPLPSERQMH